MSAAYYVSYNKEKGGALLHKAECSTCKQGRGLQEANGGGTCEWLPFNDRDVAETAAKRLTRRKSARPDRLCRLCNP